MRVMALSEISLFDFHGTFMSHFSFSRLQNWPFFPLRVYLWPNINYFDWLCIQRHRFPVLHGRTLAYGFVIYGHKLGTFFQKNATFLNFFGEGGRDKS
jgi:hypothetical protein